MAGRSGTEPATAREGHPTAMALVGIVAVAAAVVAVVDLVVLERRLHRTR